MSLLSPLRHAEKTEKAIEIARDLATRISLRPEQIFPTEDSTPAFRIFLDFLRNTEPFATALSHEPIVSSGVDTSFENHYSLKEIGTLSGHLQSKKRAEPRLHHDEIIRIINSAHTSKSLADPNWKVRYHTVDQVVGTLIAGNFEPSIFRRQGATDPTSYFQKLTLGEKSGYRFEIWSGMGKYGASLENATINNVSGGNHRLLSAMLYNRLTLDPRMRGILTPINHIDGFEVTEHHLDGAAFDDFLEKHLLIEKKSVGRPPRAKVPEIPIFTSHHQDIEPIMLARMADSITHETPKFICVDKQKLEAFIGDSDDNWTGKIKNWFNKRNVFSSYLSNVYAPSALKNVEAFRARVMSILEFDSLEKDIFKERTKS